jgi:hypothetical protein
MKKRKLGLKKITLRDLDQAALGQAGGTGYSNYWGGTCYYTAGGCPSGGHTGACACGTDKCQYPTQTSCQGETCGTCPTQTGCYTCPTYYTACNSGCATACC